LAVGGKVTPLPNDKRVEKLVDDATGRKKGLTAPVFFCWEKGGNGGFSLDKK